MYKVFVENHPVFFEKNQKNNKKELKVFLPKLILKKYNDFSMILRKISPVSLPLNSMDIMDDIFFDDFTKIYAAGGIVHHLPTNTFLFIFRNERWDIPKGKVEQNESNSEAAQREIEEECGISDISIKKHLINTYHTYHAYGRHWLKETTWFYATYTGSQNTTPQIEENITDVKWIPLDKWDEIVANTFDSIKDVLFRCKDFLTSQSS